MDAIEKERARGRAKYHRYKNRPGEKEKRSARFKSWYERNKEKQQAEKLTYYHSHSGAQKERFRRYTAATRGRAHVLLSSARKSSTRRGHGAVSLTVDDLIPILEAGVCQVTGLPFDLSRQQAGRTNPRAPSLDRPDASKPYGLDNFRIVLWAVNAGCGAWGLDEYLNIAQAALRVSRPT